MTRRDSAYGLIFDSAALPASIPHVADAGYVSRQIARPALILPPTCTEPWRGAFIWPDDAMQPHVLLVPFCARAFAEIDLDTDTAFAVGDQLSGPSGGGWAGAVLGCDVRGYALPFGSTDVLRVDQSPAGGVRVTAMPVGGPYFLNGGVVAGDCSGLANGMPIVAAGRNGLFVLRVYEERIDVTPVTTARAMGRQFTGVARLGNDVVVTNFVSDGSGAFALLYDLSTGQVQEVSGGTEATTGVATFGANFRRGFAITDGGQGVNVALAGTSNLLRLVPATNARWPVNALNGFFLVAGADLLAYDTDNANPRDGVALSPLINGGLSAGLLVAPNGELVIVPGTHAPIQVLTPSELPTVDLRSFLAPWFNKL